MVSPQNEEDSTFDKLMTYVGFDGKFQFRFNMLFNVVFILFFGLNAFTIVLAMTVPDHWCHVPGRNATNFTLEEWKQHTIPQNEDGSSLSKCHMYNTTGITFSETVAKENVTGCQYEWEYDTTWYELTAPSQENWVCDKALYVANAIFFCRAGEAIGSLIFGQLGDTIGRRPIMFISVATLVIGRVMSTLTSGSYYLFLASCFIGNFPVVTLSVTPLIVAVEMSPRKKRAYIAMVQTLGWIGGLCLIPLIAWLTGGEWKSFLVASSLPALSMFLVYRYFPESPRWLAARGKTKRCEKVLRQIAEVNGHVLNDEVVNLLHKTTVEPEKGFGIASLFSSWRLAKNTFLTCSCVFLCHILYYTLTLLVITMSGNPFVNFFVQAFVEFPGCILAKIACDNVGRRWTQGTAYALSAFIFLALSFSVTLSNVQWLLTGLVSSGKFLITASMYTAFLLNTEMYPTCVRQSGSSLGFVTSSTLGVLAPYIAYLGTVIDIKFPYIVLAALSLFGTTCSLLLPETLNQKLPETLAEAAYFGRDQKFWSCPGRSKTGKSKAEETASYG